MSWRDVCISPVWQTEWAWMDTSMHNQSSSSSIQIGWKLWWCTGDESQKTLTACFPWLCHFWLTWSHEYPMRRMIHSMLDMQNSNTDPPRWPSFWSNLINICRTLVWPGTAFHPYQWDESAQDTQTHALSFNFRRPVWCRQTRLDRGSGPAHIKQHVFTTSVQSLGLAEPYRALLVPICLGFEIL